MATSASLDTNVLLDWLLDRDSARSAATQRLLDSTLTLHVSDMVFAEIVYVLQSAKFPRVAITKNLSRIVAERAINCNRPLIKRALKLYETESRLSWVDCCSLFYAELNNASPLYTYDNDLIKKSGGRAQALR
ncbi:MAG TPA: PIN domain-containing protein [Verrucomicrobiae bacterium]|nr:PIN domain-containing protein [Verrucomicrobiae bacterium]